MKLSQFITQVLDKIEELPRDRYIPFAGVWLRPNDIDPKTNPCEACLAGLYGAAMGWFSPEEEIGSFDIDNYPGHKNAVARLSETQINTLRAIDHLRKGEWLTASQFAEVENLYYPHCGQWPTFPIAAYFTNWRQFDRHVEDLRRKARLLEQEGF